jgi:RHS repeat-associated protein
VTDQTLSFGYDAGTNGNGRLTSAADANQSLLWTYDAHGRVTGKGQTIGTVTKSVGYAYTNADLTGMTTPSGQAIVYSYNSNHQITGISINGTTLLSAVTYEPFGAINGWSWGNGTSSHRTYDTDGRISQIVSASVTNNYTFDNASRITGITDSSNSALSWTDGYDLLDRLTSAAKTGTSYGWTYDADGNRLTQTGTAATTFHIPTPNNKLSSTTGALVRTYVYTAAGQSSAYGSDIFSYNDRGRLLGVTVGSAVTSYLYNALGQLIEKSGAPGTSLYMDDEAGHLLGEYTSTGALTQETIWLGDTPVATLRPNGSSISIYYVHTDHLNTPKKVTRASDNALAWRWDQDPFGTAAPNQNPASLGTFIYNLRFPGQMYMSETGLSYNYHRDFDPQTGRYVESDPIGLKGGKNTYAYVGEKPISFADPLGLAPCYVTGYRRTPWEEIPGSQGTPWYELVSVLASDASGIAATCIYNKIQMLQDRRDVYVESTCWKCNYTGCSNPECRWEQSEQFQGQETRNRIDVSHRIVGGLALNIGGDFDPESPSNYLCTNPWTGETVGGEFGP